MIIVDKQHRLHIIINVAWETWRCYGTMESVLLSIHCEAKCVVNKQPSILIINKSKINKSNYLSFSSGSLLYSYVKSIASDSLGKNGCPPTTRTSSNVQRNRQTEFNESPQKRHHSSSKRLSLSPLENPTVSLADIPGSPESWNPGLLLCWALIQNTQEPEGRGKSCWTGSTPVEGGSWDSLPKSVREEVGTHTVWALASTVKQLEILWQFLSSKPQLPHL